MPTITVVMPVYNAQKYLKQSLYSIVNQTFKDIEIICINDGSTDASLNILSEYAAKDNRFNIITQEHKNAGVSRNIGLEAAKGEYVSFLDADDFFELNMLEELYNKAQSTDVDIVLCSAARYDDKNNTMQYPSWYLKTNLLKGKNLFSPTDVLDVLFDISPPNAWLKFYNRAFLIKNNLQFQSIEICNDVYFSYASMILSQKISFLDKPYIAYRINTPTSLSSSRGNYYECPFSAHNAIKDLLVQKGLFDKAQNSFFLRVASHLVYEYRNINKFNKKDFLNKTKEFLPTNYFEIFLNDARQYDEKQTGGSKMKALKRFIETLFSAKNDKTHKILRILGIKIRIKSAKLETKLKLKEIDDGINALSKKMDNIIKKAVETGVREIKFSNLEIKEGLEKQMRETKNLLADSKETSIQMSEELRYAAVFNSSIKRSLWLKDQVFEPNENSANYSFLYSLFKIFNEIKPRNILELGIGQTSKITTQYASFYNASLDIFDDNEIWINIYKNKLTLSNAITLNHIPLISFNYEETLSYKYDGLEKAIAGKKYDLLIIDGPFGYGDQKLPRSNILNLIPQNLSENFVIIFDDFQRQGDRKTAMKTINKLKENQIKFVKAHIKAKKEQLIICSEKYKFIRTI